jgi:hypothetical protein
LAKAGGDRKHRHVGEMRRKLPSQGIELLWGEGADSPLGFAKQLEPRHSIDPFPLATGAAKDGPNERQIAIGRSGSPDLLAVELDAVDQRSVDLVEKFAS